MVGIQLDIELLGDVFTAGAVILVPAPTSAASTLTPDLYLNYSLAILVEIPAHFATILLLDRLGRKPVLGFSQVLAGVTCIAAGFMNSHNLRWLQVPSFITNKALPSNKYLHGEM